MAVMVFPNWTRKRRLDSAWATVSTILEISADDLRLPSNTMAQQRTALWEADLEEDFHDVDLNLAIGSYGQNGLYDDGTKPT